MPLEKLAHPRAVPKQARRTDEILGRLALGQLRAGDPAAGRGLEMELRRNLLCRDRTVLLQKVSSNAPPKAL
jgi:hypothetical protein